MLEIMLRLSDRIKEMQESATLLMAAKAREMTAKGFDIIDLSLGEPDFDTPAHIKEAAKKALDDGFTKYTPVAGTLELREAICEKFKRDNDLTFRPTQICVSNGAKQCIANLCMALLNKGDEVVILSPYWVSYYEIVRMTEATPVIVNADIEQDFKVTAEQVKAALNLNTRMLIFSSPCNPSGSVFTKEELAAIADVVSLYPNVTIVSDEIYEYINFTDHHFSIGSLPQVVDQTVTVNGFAKGFAMTGWRLGYLGGPQWIVDACVKIQGQFTSGAACFSQKAAAFALRSDMSPTFEMNKVFKTRRDLTYRLLSEIEGVKVNFPQGAFYLLPDMSHFFGKQFDGQKITNGFDLSMFLLNQAHVSMVNGEAFGAPNCMRLSYATSEDKLIKAVERIKTALALLG